MRRYINRKLTRKLTDKFIAKKRIIALDQQKEPGDVQYYRDLMVS